MDLTHLTDDEKINGIRATNVPKHIREKVHGQDVRETLAQLAEMIIQLGVNLSLDPNEALEWARKLQESVSQSEFDSWVATLLDGGPSLFFETKVALVAKYPNGAPGVALVRETDPAKIYVWNGSAWEDFGDYQGIEVKDWAITSQKLANGAVTNIKIADEQINRMKLVKHFGGDTAITTGDLNTIDGRGSYLFSGTDTVTNRPPFDGYGKLEVFRTSGNWVTQLATPVTESGMYIRSLRNQNGTVDAVKPWVALGGDTYKFPYLTSYTDLNEVLEEGHYMAVNSKNAPNDSTFTLNVERFYTTKGSERFWGTQTLTDVYGMSKGETTNQYVRIFDRINSTTTQFGAWTRLSGGGVGDSNLSGAVIVNFGDSIFGNTQGANSVSQAIQDRTGATVHNLAIGGSQMSTHAQYWDAFSAYRLAYAIVNKDWTLVDDPNAKNLRNYFPATVELMKTIDFSKVDYITFNWGTNDYRQGKDLDDETNSENTNTFAGAMRYFLRTIIEAYPEIKILAISPLWRYFNDENGEYLEDSTTKSWGGGTLIEYVNKGVEVASEFNIPYLDAYRNLGINKYNRLTYFNDAAGDTTHPQANGNKRLGSLIGAKLTSEF